MKFPNYIKLFLSVVLCELAGAIGSIFTVTSIPTWYTTLVRPDIAPPNTVFGPVWTTLYALMGIALFIVWRAGTERPEVRKALKIFAAQLVLNTLWSIVFFGMHSIIGALVVIVILWFAILATIMSFKKISKGAAYLLLPYLAWVTFATFLNYGFWRLN